jgi:hypothetical protein
MNSCFLLQIAGIASIIFQLANAELIQAFTDEIVCINLKINTTPKRGGLMNPLKGGRFDRHFHRRDAEEPFN